MKALVFVILAFVVTGVFASTSYPVQTLPQSPATYTCSQYTRNQVLDDQTTTDHPVIAGVTVVKQTQLGFDIQPGEAFSKEKVLTNAQLGSAGAMAGDPETLLLRKEDDLGYPYFIIYQFDRVKIDSTGKPSKGAVIGLVVLGDCSTR